MAKKVSRRYPTLGAALSDLPTPESLPMALPASHMTDGLTFQTIVAKSELQPQFCDVFQEPLTYLFYGGVFYRRSSQPTRRATELPVAFLFDPCVLGLVDRYYPSDTGALKELERRKWPEETIDFRRRFSVPGGSYTIPCKLVSYVFQTNDSYLFGTPSSSCADLPNPFRDLFKFISRDLTGIGVDQRYRRFEAQCRIPIPLQNLVWIGYPDVFDKEFAILLEKIKPSVPQYFAYRSWPAMPPSEAAAILQNQAHQVVERYIKLPRRAA